VREGARVAIADIDGERARQTAAELGEAAIAVDMDVTDQASIDARGRRDGGGIGRDRHPDQQCRDLHRRPDRGDQRADYARVFDINVAGTLFTLQAVARHMIGAARAARSSTWPARPGGAARRWSRSIAPPRPR
jgi:NAD(P)-dependent dehydrogenase (short-subunit alcohol dehydrogenase family)